jgi:hypothetical protein
MKTLQADEKRLTDEKAKLTAQLPDDGMKKQIDALDQAQENRSGTDPLAPPKPKQGAWETVAGFMGGIAGVVEQPGIAQVSQHLRTSMEQQRKEAEQKAQELSGAARSNLLQATSGRAGEWRGVLDVIRKLSEDAVKGR